MMNTKPGWKAIVKRPNTEIAILVSCCRVETLGKVTVLHTDRHADAEALVNTVNTVGVSGKGVALMFEEAFPDNLRAHDRAR